MSVSVFLTCVSCFLFNYYLCVIEAVKFSTFLYYLWLCCDCNKCIYNSYTHSINIYINIYEPTNMIGVCQGWSCTYIALVSCPSWGGMWSSGRLIESVNWRLWLGAGGWMSITGWGSRGFTVHRTASCSCKTHVLTKCSFSFLDPLCTSNYSFKVIRVVFLLLFIWKQVEDAVRK